MRIQVPFDISNLGAVEDLGRYVSQITKQLVDLVNGKISLTENADTDIISVTFNATNQDVITSHSLRRIPTGYIPINLTSAMIVYNGSLANTDALTYLRSSAVGTAKLLLF